MSTWIYPLGSLGRDGWQVAVSDRIEGWQHTGLKVAEVAGGDRLALASEPIERIIVPLAGSFTVDLGGADVSGAGLGSVTLAGRASVFDGPTDVLYLGPHTPAVIAGIGRVAVAEAAATEPRAPQYVPAEGIAVELRGGGNASRQVHNFGTPGNLDAHKIIACEVITPAGNWSSYPPHKHDEDKPGAETRLEEIYYFETRVEGSGAAPQLSAPHGFQRVSASDSRPIDVFAQVGTGDVVLVPYGWHGPSMAPPGYDLYYLNVMAGPGTERAWRITDHPDHAWVRGQWPGQGIDPRLPFGR